MSGWPGRLGRVVRVATLSLLLALPLSFSSAGRAGAAEPTDVAVARLVTGGARSLGKPAVQRDARLDAAARMLLGLYPHSDAIENDVASAALWQEQVVEPIHRLLIVRYGSQRPDELLAALPAQVRVLLGTGRWHRFGVGVVPVPAGADGASGDSRVMVVVLESFVKLTPPPPAKLGAAPTPLAGTLQPPYGRPKVVVTAPSGAVETPPLTAHEREFSGALRCAERGRYQVEVLGEDKGGPTVLANFPWYCDQAPPVLGITAAAVEAPWRDARDAEQQVLALLNRDRQRAHLPALPLDDKLSAVARAHCQDMAEHKFVAHLSPRTGGPADRVRRAGIAAAIVSENLAQARTPKEVEEGLMGSPGHRGNILDSRVSRVGIGAQETVGVAGIRQLVVTQLFVSEPATADLRDASARVVRTLQAQRTAARQPELLVDGELNQLAARTAAGIASGKIAENHADALLDQALPSLRQRFAAVRTALAVAQSPEQIGEATSIVDPAATHIGIAVVARPGKRVAAAQAEEAPALYIVVMVARRSASR